MKKIEKSTLEPSQEAATGKNIIDSSKHRRNNFFEGKKIDFMKS